MKNYIYKIIIAAIALIIVFEFTIGRKFNKIDEISNNFLTKEGRKRIINSIKNEMEKATEKENYLTENERILINKFISKIKKELNTTKSN
jgi:hypothetical protein|tara:strand:- start:327 stop:596 length:270 start_codon:yes stop_codon:yes gene_type:complete